MNMENNTILKRFSLEGKTALVTGGGQGIGRSFCHALGEAGAKVAVVDLNRDTADLVVSELHRKGIDDISITADVTKEKDSELMVKRIVETWGFLTIGVNNAGIGMWRDSESMSLNDWKKIIDLNLNAVFICAQKEAEAMLKKGYGKIINTASMSGHIVNTPQNQTAYNTSKAGVLHLTRSLAAEWASLGIRVNSISPGYTETKLVSKLLETPEGKTMLPEWIKKIPLGKMGTPEDLQGAVCYLAASVSDYMTGSDLLIDGGYCCW